MKFVIIAIVALVIVVLRRSFKNHSKKMDDLEKVGRLAFQLHYGREIAEYAERIFISYQDQNPSKSNYEVFVETGNKVAHKMKSEGREREVISSLR